MSQSQPRVYHCGIIHCCRSHDVPSVSFLLTLRWARSQQVPPKCFSFICSSPLESLAFSRSLLSIPSSANPARRHQPPYPQILPGAHHEQKRIDRDRDHQHLLQSSPPLHWDIVVVDRDVCLRGIILEVAQLGFFFDEAERVIARASVRHCWKIV